MPVLWCRGTLSYQSWPALCRGLHVRRLRCDSPSFWFNHQRIVGTLEYTERDMSEIAHTPGPDTDDLFILRNTKLPRHHRDAEDEMHWAADEIERLRRVNADLVAELRPTITTILNMRQYLPKVCGTLPLQVNATENALRAAITKATGGTT